MAQDPGPTLLQETLCWCCKFKDSCGIDTRELTECGRFAPEEGSDG